MRFGKHLVATAATALLVGCGAADEQSAAAPSATDQAAADTSAPLLARADIIDTSGKSAGSATIAPSGDRFVLTLNANGLAPGEHGMHLHMVGACDLPDFTSAGSHLNPHNKQHGRDNPQGSHLGDLPNITADADGAASLSVPLDVSQAEIDQNLMDADGTAIVVHATADDYRTDPTGNSGGRIACGVLKRS